MRPDLFITSPRLRASQTAEIVAEALGKRVVVDERLAGPLDAERRDRDPPLARTRPSGHASSATTRTSPSCWASSSASDAIPMRKGAIARVDVDGPDVVAGTGQLRYLLPPDLPPRR